MADGLDEWFTGEACDGFVLAATRMPGAYEDYVRLVVPELQRRGLHQRDYAGNTLRENLGLPRPARGAWRKGLGSARNVWAQPRSSPRSTVTAWPPRRTRSPAMATRTTPPRAEAW